MKKITIYCEVNYSNNSVDDVSYELISKAVQLKKQALELNNSEYIIEAVVLAPKLNEEFINKAYQSGAQRVVLVKESTLDTFSQRICAKSFVDYINENKTEVILFPATNQGRSVAPRITTLLEVGLVADCTELEFILKNDEIKLAATRPTFGSELMATILSKKNPQCATIRQGVFKAEFNSQNTGEYIEYDAQTYSDNGLKLLRSTPDNSNEENFKNAKVVLCAGYGIYDKTGEYYDKLEKIAKITRSKLAATRKVVDFGFASRENQIGQTGSNTEADLYIAFGVSGAIQHIQGMKNSKKIIAINLDENADIFKYADYKIVADARIIIDEMLSSLT